MSSGGQGPPWRRVARPARRQDRCWSRRRIPSAAWTDSGRDACDDGSRSGRLDRRLQLDALRHSGRLCRPHRDERGLNHRHLYRLCAVKEYGLRKQSHRRRPRARCTIVSSGDLGNGFELFGTIDQVGGKGAAFLVQPTAVSLGHSRINGCLILTGGGCGGEGPAIDPPPEILPPEPPGTKDPGDGAPPCSRLAPGHDFAAARAHRRRTKTRRSTSIRWSEPTTRVCWESSESMTQTPGAIRPGRQARNLQARGESA